MKIESVDPYQEGASGLKQRGAQLHTAWLPGKQTQKQNQTNKKSDRVPNSGELCPKGQVRLPFQIVSIQGVVRWDHWQQGQRHSSTVTRVTHTGQGGVGLGWVRWKWWGGWGLDNWGVGSRIPTLLICLFFMIFYSPSFFQTITFFFIPSKAAPWEIGTEQKHCTGLMCFCCRQDANQLTCWQDQLRSALHGQTNTSAIISFHIYFTLLQTMLYSLWVCNIMKETMYTYKNHTSTT